MGVCFDSITAHGCCASGCLALQHCCRQQLIPCLDVFSAAGHTRWVWDCVFSVDAAYLVTASSDATARLWDLSAGNHILNGCYWSHVQMGLLLGRMLYLQ
jgi:WD40 repeat protein